MFADAAKCPNLQKKPKMFFFQVLVIKSFIASNFLIKACRGNEVSATGRPQVVQTDGAVHCIDGWPAISDYMVGSVMLYLNI